MQNLNEAVINLINEDVVNAKKILEQELYVRLGGMLEEKLKEFAPTVFESKKAKKDYDGDGKVESGSEEYLGSRDKAIKKSMQKESEDLGEDLIIEDYEELVNQLESLVEEIEAETGEELSESDIEDLAGILLEQLEEGPDEVEEDEEEDFEEEDFEENS